MMKPRPTNLKSISLLSLNLISWLRILPLPGFCQLPPGSPWGSLSAPSQSRPGFAAWSVQCSDCQLDCEVGIRNLHDGSDHLATHPWAIALMLILAVRAWLVLDVEWNHRRNPGRWTAGISNCDLLVQALSTEIGQGHCNVRWTWLICDWFTLFWKWMDFLVILFPGLDILSAQGSHCRNIFFTQYGMGSLDANRWWKLRTRMVQTTELATMIMMQEK